MRGEIRYRRSIYLLSKSSHHLTIMHAAAKIYWIMIIRSVSAIWRYT